MSRMVTVNAVGAGGQGDIVRRLMPLGEALRLWQEAGPWRAFAMVATVEPGGLAVEYGTDPYADRRAVER